eukprot:GCRY01003744.1.p1 GENE.GCRY01003744.1~~GCRY01003744.1.p1  ORF type:complete len:392 (-),score=82.04 GCRY01003744.1:307-1482(-)
MSYRELRNFSERLKVLGFSKSISIESFKNPNFDLMAEILLWLIRKYDPTISVYDDISTEMDRVQFLKTIAQIMATKAHLKLNTKRLYSADGYAVKELLKITNMLYSAKTLSTEATENSNTDFNFQNKIHSLKASRNLSSEITNKGVELFDSLANEHELNATRRAVIARPLDMEAIEKELKSTVQKLKEETQKMLKNLDNISTDEASLEAKIKKRKADLERNQKRLDNMQSVRPAFMDEYVRLEKELQGIYSVYLTKFRNLEYLENELGRVQMAEEERLMANDKALRLMQKALREEEMKVLRGEGELSLDLRETEENAGEYATPTFEAPLAHRGPRPANQLDLQFGKSSGVISDSDDEQIDMGNGLSDGEYIDGDSTDEVVFDENALSDHDF